MQLLRSSQLVKDVQPLRDGSGWYATLWCRAVHCNRPSEQRQFSKTRTTDEACLRDLLDLINTKHGAHLEAAEAARAAAAAEAAAEAGPSTPTNAFQAMQAARHVGPAVEKAEAAERLVAEARRGAALETQLAAANAALEAAETELRRLEEEADAAREAAGLPRKQQRGEEADAEPTYRSWTLSKWNELETKEQRRREVPIDLSMHDCVGSCTTVRYVEVSLSTLPCGIVCC